MKYLFLSLALCVGGCVPADKQTPADRRWMYCAANPSKCPCEEKNGCKTVDPQSLPPWRQR